MISESAKSDRITDQINPFLITANDNWKKSCFSLVMKQWRKIPRQHIIRQTCKHSRFHTYAQLWTWYSEVRLSGYASTISELTNKNGDVSMCCDYVFTVGTRQMSCCAMLVINSDTKTQLENAVWSLWHFSHSATSHITKQQRCFSHIIPRQQH